MDKLTPEEYRSMVLAYRLRVGESTARQVIDNVVKVFKTVENVIAYGPNGVVHFANGQVWRFNLKPDDPTFYRIDKGGLHNE